MNNPLAGTDPSGYLWCGTGALEKAECNDERKHKRRDSGSVGFRAAETYWVHRGSAASNGARHSPRSAANGERERGAIGGPGEGGGGGRHTSDIEKELGGSLFEATEDGWTLNWSENVTREDKSDLVGQSEDSFYVGLVDELTRQAQNLKNAKVDPSDTNDNFLIQGLNSSAFRKYTMTSDVYENYTQVSGEIVYSLRNVNTNETRFLRRENISGRENIFRSATLRSVDFKGFVGVANLPRGTQPQTYLYLRQMQRSVGKNIIKLNVGGN
ncbi:hypothetical protein CWE21_05840 [Pseudidiomarina aquimaris]|uniref:Uncharacterized protein n=2 Tax=Pseudidiomarina aquimaris TaxID=641841 RepID=A0A432XJW1_9GAMM|nr:hypothetical protein CWE21_05840 [Pseudidiomarina aquimaris]